MEEILPQLGDKEKNKIMAWGFLTTLLLKQIQLNWKSIDNFTKCKPFQQKKGFQAKFESMNISDLITYTNQSTILVKIFCFSAGPIRHK